jgi:hypothetical protein
LSATIPWLQHCSLEIFPDFNCWDSNLVYFACHK